MSDLTRVSTSRAPAAIGPYSQAIASGGLIFTAGQIPLPASGGELIEGGIREQTEQVLRNLSEVLREGGASLSSVVKTTVFLADMGEFSEMNAVYERAFDGHAPARSTVQVAALPKGARVEIEAIAVRSQGS